MKPISAVRKLGSDFIGSIPGALSFRRAAVVAFGVTGSRLLCLVALLIFSVHSLNEMRANPSDWVMYITIIGVGDLMIIAGFWFFFPWFHAAIQTRNPFLIDDPRG